MLFASVNSVYEACQRQAAKDERGFITPSDFNTYASLSSLELFQEKLSEYEYALRKRNGYLNFRRGKFNSIQKLRGDLKTLLVSKATLSYNTILSKFTFPDDYAYFDGINTDSGDITLVDQSEADIYSKSFLCPPTTNNKVAYFDREGVSVMPSTVTSGISLNYYKIPQGSTIAGVASTMSPIWGFTEVGGKEIYNPSTSINFEFPKHLESELTYKILDKIGIEIREPELIQYSENEDLKNSQNNIN